MSGLQYGGSSKPVFNVADYGAVGGGVVPVVPGANGAAFQAAIDAAAQAGGGIVLVPVDRFYFGPGVYLTLWPGVSLTGSIPGPFETIGRDPITQTLGPTLLITDTTGFINGFGTNAPSANNGNCFLAFGGQQYISDLIFAYPNQIKPSADYSIPFVPVFYPLTLAPNLVTHTPGLSGALPYGTFIERITIFNAYDGILCDGRAELDHCIIGAYHRPMTWDFAADTNKANDLRFSQPWNDAYQLAGLQGNGGFPSSNADVWCMYNQVMVTIGRSDAFIMTNVGCYGGYVGYDVYQNGVVAYGQLINCRSEAANYGIRLRGPSGPIQTSIGQIVPTTPLFFYVVGGPSVVAGDVVSTTLTPPVGSPVTVSYTVTSSDAGQPALAQKWQSVATNFAAAIAASAAVTGGSAFLKMNTPGVDGGTQGALFAVYSNVAGATLTNASPALSIGITLSATGGHTTLTTLPAGQSTLLPGTWFRVESSASGSTFLMDGLMQVQANPNQLGPQVIGNGQYFISAYGWDRGAGSPGTGPLGKLTLSASQQTYGNPTTSPVMVSWSGGDSGTAVFFGSYAIGITPTPANQIGGGPSGSLRLEVSGFVTFVSPGALATLWPYVAGETS